MAPEQLQLCLVSRVRPHDDDGQVTPGSDIYLPTNDNIDNYIAVTRAFRPYYNYFDLTLRQPRVQIPLSLFLFDFGLGLGLGLVNTEKYSQDVDRWH